MKLIDIAQLQSDMTSDATEKRIQAIEQAVKISQILAESAAKSLESSQGNPYVAERLPRFGSIMTEPLTRIYDDTTDKDVKTFAALALLDLGSQHGVSWLLKALKSDSENICVIANNLCRAQLVEAIEPITDVIQDFKARHSDVILCLLDALSKLNVALSSEVRNRLGAFILDQLSAVDIEDFESIAKWLEILKVIQYPLPSDIAARLQKNQAAARTLENLEIT